MALAASFDPKFAHNPNWKKIYPDYSFVRSPLCPECQEQVKQYCSGCHLVGYCDKEHQKKHWSKIHKDQCCSFKLIQSKNGKGRILVATRDIQPGEIIFKEKPITVGPKQFTTAICLGCYIEVNDSFRCPNCRWPFCSIECSKRPIHSSMECEVLAKCYLKPVFRSSTPEEMPIYDCITPLRVLLAKDLVPQSWEIVDRMESHTELQKSSPMYEVNQNNIIKFIIDRIGYTNTTLEQITKAQDVLEMNAFEIRGKNFSIRGLYPLTAMMNSVCSPNTYNSIDSEYECRVISSTLISKGSEITATYTHTLEGTLYRRNQLKVSKYFDCDCRRCSDPTELGSHFSTVLCQRNLPGRPDICKGFVLPDDPLKDNSDWTCMGCKEKVTVNQINKIIQLIKNSILEHSGNIRGMELLISTTMNELLHPNHSLFMDIKFYILGAINSATVSSGPLMLEEKKTYIEDILDVMALVTPGISRLRGTLSFELFTVYHQLLQISKENENFKIKAIHFLEETISMLKYESPGTPEGDTLKLAMSAKNSNLLT